MAYKQTYNQGSLFMNYMNAKTYLESHRDDRVPPFALAPCSFKYITEGIRTQEKSRCIILVTSESVLFVQLTPVNYADGSGHIAVALALLILGGIGAVAGFASQSISDAVTGKGFDWGSVTTAFFDFGFKSVNINWGSVLANSAVMGSLNIYAGAASGMSSLIDETGKTAVQANSVLVARLLAGTLSGSAEAIYDSTSLFIGWLFERFGL